MLRALLRRSRPSLLALSSRSGSLNTLRSSACVLSRQVAFAPRSRTVSGRDRPSFAERVDKPSALSSVYLVLFALGTTGGAYYLAARQTNKSTFRFRLFHSSVVALGWGDKFPPNEKGFRKLVETLRLLEGHTVYEYITAWRSQLPPAVAELVPELVQKAIHKTATWLSSIWGSPDTSRVFICLGFAYSALAVFPKGSLGQPSKAWFDRIVHNPMLTRPLSLFTNQLIHTSLSHLWTCFFFFSPLGMLTYVWMSSSQEETPSGMYEGTTGYHFLFFLAAAGAWSTMISTLAFRSFGYRQLVSNVAAGSLGPQPLLSTPAARLLAKAKGFFVPYHPPRDLKNVPTPLTHGSSGVTYAAAMVSILSPYSAMFLHDLDVPMAPFQVAFGGLLLSDAIAAGLGWRRFDHWAHLGGAAFGALYYRYGMKCWNSMRTSLWSEDAFQLRAAAVRARILQANKKKKSSGSHKA